MPADNNHMMSESEREGCKILLNNLNNKINGLIKLVSSHSPYDLGRLRSFRPDSFDLDQLTTDASPSDFSRIDNNLKAGIALLKDLPGALAKAEVEYSQNATMIIGLFTGISRQEDQCSLASFKEERERFMTDCFQGVEKKGVLGCQEEIITYLKKCISDLPVRALDNLRKEDNLNTLAIGFLVLFFPISVFVLLIQVILKACKKQSIRNEPVFRLMFKKGTLPKETGLKDSNSCVAVAC
jgi:hypothetical protein